MAPRLTYTSVNNANLDTLPGNSLVLEPVDLCHQVSAEGVATLLPLRQDGLDGVTRGMDDVVRDGIAPDRVDALDLWHAGHLGNHLVGILGVLELDGRALEQFEAEVLAEGRFSCSQVPDEGIGVLVTLVNTVRETRTATGSYPPDPLRTRQCRRLGRWRGCPE